MGIINHFVDQGYKVIWPVMQQFVEGNNRAYPQATFVPQNMFDQKLFQIKEDKIVDGVRIIPIRWSDQILKQPSKYWMKTKYMLYGLDYTKWKDGAEYMRSEERERRLYYD